MSASEGTTTFAMGSSDMHRVPSKPFAPAQGIKSLEGARSITALSSAWAPRRARGCGAAAARPWPRRGDPLKPESV